MEALNVRLCAALLCFAATAAEAEVRRIGDVGVHSGMCDASAAVAIPEGGTDAFIVANDEDNRIRAYARDQSAALPTLAGGDFSAFLRVGDSKREADVEGAAQLGGQIYWIGSHGRNSEGKPRPERQVFFATAARRGAGGATVLEPVGAPRDLRQALSRPRLGLADALGGPGTDRSLAPEGKGLNIEGLAAGPDGASLLIGLRNPLRGREAVLLPLENPAAVVEGRERPRFGDPFLLDLNGRGVRSIEYSAARAAYVIAAGPVADPADGDRRAFDLFGWTGRRGDAAVPLAGAADVLAGLRDEGGHFAPEAMVVDPTGTRVLLLSDDGDRRMQGGAKCKDVPDAGARRLRSVTLGLD